MVTRVNDHTGQPVTLDLRSGGWALLLGVALGAIALVYFIVNARRASDVIAFDLSTCLVPTEQVVKATSPEALPPLVEPPLLGPDEAQAYKLPKHGKYLLADDRVVGVAINGEACAYPLRVMHWHEVVDHTVGGTPIAVTYTALTDSARVFDRRVGGETLELAASGLVWNSNPLLFDRRAAGPGARPSSLWSQLQARAVSGPAAVAGQRLEVVPAALTTWARWRAAHPETRVIAPDPARAERYRKDPYSAYAGSELLRFPVAPLPPTEPGITHKTVVVVVGPPGERVVYPLPWLAKRVAQDGGFTTTQDGAQVVFRYGDHPPHVEVDVPAGSGWDVVHASWFAWYSQHPDDARLATDLRP
jgi:hypothetical protein